MWLVWDDPPIVREEVTKVRSAEHTIEGTVSGYDGFCLKGFRKSLTADPIFGARCVRLPLSTGTVDHGSHEGLQVSVMKDQSHESVEQRQWHLEIVDSCVKVRLCKMKGVPHDAHGRANRCLPPHARQHPLDHRKGRPAVLRD